MKPGLGTQLRHLLDLLDGAVGHAYDEAGIAWRPRYTPVMRALVVHEPSTIGQIAAAAGITQPAATQTVALMTREGFVSAAPGSHDARQRLIRLTPKARRLLPHLQECWEATAMAADGLDASVAAPLSDALRDAIAALETRSFGVRIAEARARLRKPKQRRPETTTRKRT